MKQGIIYSISCPIHKNIFYVGQTMNLEKRIKYYFHEVSPKSTPAELYVKKINEAGNKPVFTIHTRCEEAELNMHEYGLIKECIDKGLLLLNWKGNNRDNYNSAREFYLGVSVPEINDKVDIVDLTAIAS